MAVTMRDVTADVAAIAARAGQTKQRVKGAPSVIELHSGIDGRPFMRVVLDWSAEGQQTNVSEESASHLSACASALQIALCRVRDMERRAEVRERSRG